MFGDGAFVTWEIARTWDDHAATPHEVARVQLARAEGGGLVGTIDAPYHGDPPPPGVPGPTDALWEHEVVEVFIVGPGERYLEVEIGPHGHHLVLILHGRRRVAERLLPLDARWFAGAAGRWQASFTLPEAWLPPEPWTANAFAIHGAGAQRRYLCACPTGGDRPDFHRLESFRPFAPPAV